MHAWLQVTCSRLSYSAQVSDLATMYGGTTIILALAQFSADYTHLLALTKGNYSKTWSSQDTEFLKE